MAFRKDKYMKLIKEYLCDDITPSDEEIRECLEIVEREMTFDECKDKLPRVYGL